VMDDAVAMAKANVEKEMVTDRPGNRRKSGGRVRHLHNSFEAELDWDGIGFPIYLVLKSKDDPKKVKALEEGSGWHEISPRNGDFLSWPRTAGRAGTIDEGGNYVRNERGRKASASTRQGAYGGVRGPRGGKSRWVRIYGPVMHPGNRPYNFMGRAIEKAVRQAFRNL
jgi:hypothetical protein